VTSRQERAAASSRRRPGTAGGRGEGETKMGLMARVAIRGLPKANVDQGQGRAARTSSRAIATGDLLGAEQPEGQQQGQDNAAERDNVQAFAQ